MLPFCRRLTAATCLHLASHPDTPTRQHSFHDTVSPLTPSITSPGIHFLSGTRPKSPLLLPDSWIPSVLSHIRQTFSCHYFLRPHPSQQVQPFLLHPLIPACLLPDPADAPPLLPFRAALSTALHILSLLLHPSRRLTGLLQPACGVLLSSPASDSSPDSFPCLSTYSCPQDDLPKPVQFITICSTHSHSFRTYYCLVDVLLILVRLITMRAIHSHPVPAHQLAHYYCLTIPDPFSTGNLI